MFDSPLPKPISSYVVKVNSAISIVNAIGTGYGATIGIDIPCTVEATLSPGGKGVISKAADDKHDLIPTCVNYVERFLRRGVPRDRALSIVVSSEIPPAVGLKSSSAVSVAVVSAVAKLLLAQEGRKTAIDSKEILELSCNASKRSGASLTGAYDDAVSCLLGGLTLADNMNHRALSHTSVPKELGSIALVRIPSGSRVYTSTIKPGEYRRFKANLIEAFNLAERGNIQGAMMLNSLVQCSALDYPFDPIISAILEGATCAGVSGKGPAVAALCRTNKVASRIERTWNEKNDDSVKFIKTAVVETPREYLCP